MSAPDRHRSEFFRSPRLFEGRRLGVWWPDDHCYYYGVLEAAPSAKKARIRYDDSERETLDLTCETFCWEGEEEAEDKSVEMEVVRADLQSFLGRRLAIQWPWGEFYFSGQLESAQSTRKATIRYDDGSMVGRSDLARAHRKPLGTLGD
eukprot:scaffold1518_cov417-Prasinococcus_capsulatus_cf.AAC.10